MKRIDIYRSLPTEAILFINSFFFFKFKLIWG